MKSEMKSKPGKFKFWLSGTALFLLSFFLVRGETDASLLSDATFLIVSAAVIIVLLGLGFFLYLEFASKAQVLRRLLQRIASRMEEEPAEVLKKHYQEVHRRYIKLPEREKQNFYPRVVHLREKIESQLKLEKKIESLFQKADKGSFAERRKVYQELYFEFRKLSSKVQEKYHPRLICLREQLERGYIRE